MDGLAIELTNVCNRRCLHCIRNKADAPEFMSLALAREVLEQARALGFRTVCLTGGEVALYPHLKEFLALVADQGLAFNLVTNGHRFREYLLPLLTAPKIKERLTAVSFSLDGAHPETHDALRGRGSFREVVEAATLCQVSGIAFGFKTIITNFNKEELTEVALLGADLGAQDHGFLHPFPSPQAIRAEVSLTLMKSGKFMGGLAAAWPKRCVLRYSSKVMVIGPPCSPAPTSWMAPTWIIRGTWFSAATSPTSPGKMANLASLAGNGWQTSKKCPSGKGSFGIIRRWPDLWKQGFGTWKTLRT